MDGFIPLQEWEYASERGPVMERVSVEGQGRSGTETGRGNSSEREPSSARSPVSASTFTPIDSESQGQTDMTDIFVREQSPQLTLWYSVLHMPYLTYYLPRTCPSIHQALALHLHGLCLRPGRLPYSSLQLYHIPPRRICSLLHRTYFRRLNLSLPVSVSSPNTTTAMEASARPLHLSLSLQCLKVSLPANTCNAAVLISQLM